MTTERANRFPMPAWIAVLLIAMLFTTGTAWAGLTFTVVTEPAEAGEGGSYEMRKISEDVYSDRQFIVIPEEGFTVKSVIWTDKDRIPETLTEISMVGEGGTIESYYTAPNASGEVVITFEMKKKRCGKTSSDKVYWAFSNNEKGLLDISYKSGGSEMADYERYEDTPWWQYHETIKTLVVNEGVTTIGKNAFGRLGALTSVSLPNSLTSIGEKAFEGCNSLTSLKIPSGVTYIEKNAFDYCSGLTTVNVYAATPPELGSNVFDDNASDRKIYVPYAALDDYKDAYGWSNYKDDILPLAATLPYTLIIESNYVDGPNVEISVSYDLSLTENNHHYTLNATYLEAQFNRSGGHTIVGWATTPGSDVVYAPGSTIVLTENPTTIYTVWDDTDKWSVTKSKGSDVYDVLTIKSVGAMADYEEYEDTPWWQYHETIKTLVVNEGVTTIGKDAFGHLGALTSVRLPHSLTSIGEKAFDSCSGLTSLKIPSSVTVIGNGALMGCDGLTSIDIPASVTSIKDDAFRSCTSLKTVNVYAITPPKLGTDVFDGNASDRKVYVPSAALDAYKKAGGWSDYKDDILPLEIPYIDADGNTAYCYDFTPLDGSETRLNNNVDTNNDGTPDQGWYVVSSDISYTNTITLDGDIHLILCDGNTMSVNTNVVSLDGYTKSNGANLTIYGQTNQTGRLEAYSDGDDTIILNNGNYTQYGGDVYLSNTYDISVLSGWALNVSGTDAVGGNVTLSRGKLTASAKARGGTAIAAGNDVNILGGQLDAQGGTEGEDADGIYTYLGNITLGWTTAADRIKVSSYHAHGTIKIADGQTLYDEDGVAYTGDNLGTIDGKTLRGVLEKRGDANGDGSISVTDIAVVVNCILQLDNNGGYSPYGADANGDGQVTVTDIGVIVDKILGSPSPTTPEGGEPQ